MQNSWQKINSLFMSSQQTGNAFSLEILDRRQGLLVFRVEGKQAYETFKNEPGGHRWQRSSPTEKRGRIHTSTITVAVLPIPNEREIEFGKNELKIKTCRGSGAGGQHKNVTNSAVQIIHVPTNIQVRVESGRSQHHNKERALEILRAKIQVLERNKISKKRSSSRKSQIGSGMRGDKRRTIRIRDGLVTDHVLEKTWNLKNYMKGKWE